MNKPILVVLFFAILLVSFFTYKFYKTPPAKKEVEYKSGLTKSVNMYPFDFDDAGFSGFNIEIPYSYYVTSDEMLVSYDSQGGMAPPRLILMKGYQVMGEDDYMDHILNNPSFPCVAIWSTRAFEDGNDWNNLITQSKSPLSEIETINVGSRSAQIFETSNEFGKLYSGFLPINDAEQTSYYLHTCNDTNKSDLIDIMKSFKFRGDVYN